MQCMVTKIVRVFLFRLEIPIKMKFHYYAHDESIGENLHQYLSPPLIIEV